MSTTWLEDAFKGVLSEKERRGKSSENFEWVRVLYFSLIYCRNMFCCISDYTKDLMHYMFSIHLDTKERFGKQRCLHQLPRAPLTHNFLQLPGSCFFSFCSWRKRHFLTDWTILNGELETLESFKNLPTKKKPNSFLRERNHSTTQKKTLLEPTKTTTKQRN